MTLASWYGPGFNGRSTSTGVVFDSGRLTAASRALPLGSYVRVTNLDNGRSVMVRINDHGPFVHGRGIDLSQAAAERLGFRHEGVARVQVTRLDATASAIPVEPQRMDWDGAGSSLLSLAPPSSWPFQAPRKKSVHKLATGADSLKCVRVSRWE